MTTYAPRELTPEIEAGIAKAYKAGGRAEQLQREYHLTPEGLRELLVRYGVKLRTRRESAILGNTRSKPPAADIRRYHKWYMADPGRSLRDVEVNFGLQQARVRHWFEQLGLPRKRTGSQSAGLAKVPRADLIRDGMGGSWTIEDEEWVKAIRLQEQRQDRVEAVRRRLRRREDGCVFKWQTCPGQF